MIKIAVSKKQIFIISFWSLCLSACTTTSQVGESDSGASSFSTEGRSIKSYMAEMEQYLNDVFRFYDDESMHTVLMERIDLVIQYHDGYIKNDPDLFEKMPGSMHSEMRHLYKYHTLKSKRLFQELKTAITVKDYSQVEEILNQLDQNRRDSHTIFG